MKERLELLKQEKQDFSGAANFVNEVSISAYFSFSSLAGNAKLIFPFPFTVKDQNRELWNWLPYKAS